VGTLLLAERHDGLLAIRFPHESPCADWRQVDRLEMPIVEQLESYFAGEPVVFDLPLAEVGTPFRRRVWAAVSAVSFGETRTYGQIATDIGMPAASRAVGAANGANPRPIVVPCHRIVGSNGWLTGYAGGVKLKQALLDHEGGLLTLADQFF
jgi:methylated-DNA-[protein]-cysteine S-methyltransferase